MRNQTIKVNDNSIGFYGLLTLIFITLKLTNLITWSWFWVLSPIIIPTSLLLLVGLFTVLVMVLKK